MKLERPLTAEGRQHFKEHHPYAARMPKGAARGPRRVRVVRFLGGDRVEVAWDRRTYVVPRSCLTF